MTRPEVRAVRLKGNPAMTTLNHGSATIYQFPLRGRFAVNADRAETTLALPQGAKVAVGGAWYHDEAIQNDGKQAS